MLLEPHFIPDHKGYFAGRDDGIVTVAGQGAVGNLYVFDARTMLLVQRARSLASGHYLVPYLDPTRRYVLMARHPQGHYEPVCYDQLRPANNLTITEQREVWRAWQAP
jgi:hypothetical protein